MASAPASTPAPSSTGEQDSDEAKAEAKAEDLKGRGNDHFKHGRFSQALDDYTSAIELLDVVVTSDGGNSTTKLKSTLLSNRAAAHLKVGKWNEVVEDCDRALRFNAANKKARFRRAEGLQRLERLDEALRDVVILCDDFPNAREFQEKAKQLRDGMASRSGSLQASMKKLQTFSDLGSGERVELFRTICTLAVKSGIESESFCCKGGLDALTDVLTSSMEYFSSVCSAIGVVGTTTSASAALCSAFLRDRLEHFNAKQVKCEEDVTAFLRMHDDVAYKLSECEQLRADQIRAVVRANFHLMDSVPSKPLKGTCVKQMLLSKLGGRFWEFLFESESYTARMMIALLSDGYSSRKSLLHLIGIAKETLGMEKLKSQILLIMTGKALSEDVELSTLDSALLIETLFMLMPEEGSWLLSSTPAYEQLLQIADTDDDLVLKVLSGILSQLASNKEGQAKFREPRVQKILANVAKREDYQTKANSLLVLAKIASVEDSHEEDEGIALEAVTLLKELDKVEEAVGSSEAYLEVVTNLVEVLVFMVNDSTIKDHIAANLMDKKTVRRLASGALRSASLSFGLSRIFAYVLATQKEIETVPLLTEDMDEDQAARKMASEMLKKQQSKQREDSDTPQKCSKRKLAFVDSEGVSGLSMLLRASSLITREQVAAALFYCASERGVRARMVQQGALSLIMKLLAGGGGGGGGGGVEEGGRKQESKCKLLSSHALARILISTNPGLLEETQVVASVRPLLLLIGRDYALQQFEGLLALTNLATVGMEVQEKIIEHGFGTIEELQWSSNQMVVRAATELLCNCVSCDKVLHSIKDPSRQKLWCSLALSEDQPLALASAGALAMASGDAAVSSSLLKNGSFAELLDMADSDHPGMQHRAYVTLENLTLDKASFQELDSASRCKITNAIQVLKEKNNFD